MHKILVTFTVLIFGVATFCILFKYNMDIMQRETDTTALEQNSMAVIYDNLDKSFHALQQHANIEDLAKYEADFQKSFTSTTNRTESQTTITYEYLYLAENNGQQILGNAQAVAGGMIKGIENTVIIDGNRYSRRYILDIKD